MSDHRPDPRRYLNDPFGDKKPVKTMKPLEDYFTPVEIAAGKRLYDCWHHAVRMIPPEFALQDFFERMRWIETARKFRLLEAVAQ